MALTICTKKQQTDVWMMLGRPMQMETVNLEKNTFNWTATQKACQSNWQMKLYPMPKKFFSWENVQEVLIPKG